MENAGSIANRDEPIPMLRVNDADLASNASTTPRSTSPRSSSRFGIRDALSNAQIPEKLQEKLQDAGLQDRFFSALFQQIFPQPDGLETTGKVDRRSSKYVQRPGFSLPLMSSNFRRFNARIGVVFVLQNRLIRLFSWKVPTQTLSFLAVYTFCCLDPSLLVVLPVAACVLFVMVPAFLTRHPPAPSTSSIEAYRVQGPASGLAPNVKPAPEMSKDFFHNMRDLQNSMEDFSVMHDRFVGVVAPLTNFADERLSSTVFLLLFLLSCILFIAASLIPWRFIYLVSGWSATCSLHPAVIRFIAQIDKAPFERQVKHAKTSFLAHAKQDIVLDAAPEKREVEIFELQRRTDDEWEPWLYSTSAYTPRSPRRLSGDRPRGTRFFDDVAPPKGWEWSSKKWVIDLLSNEWVEERMVNSVHVDMDGERWVYDDLPNEKKRRKGDGSSDTTNLEDNTISESYVEWRRRRWVRQVQRKVIKADSANRARV